MQFSKHRGAPFLAGTLLLIGFLALAACGSSSTKPLTATDILSLSNQTNLKDAQFNLKMTLSGGSFGSTPVDGTGQGKQTINPSRISFTFAAKVKGYDFSVVSISSDGYDYTKTAIPGLGVNPDKYSKTKQDSTSLKADFDHVQNPTIVGIETVAGYQAYHIKGTPSGTTVATDTEDFWIRKDNFYPLQFRELSTSTDATTGQTSTIDATITYTTWNTGVTIQVPSPSEVTTG